MLSDEVEAQYTPSRAWSVFAAATLRKRIPGGPLPEGEALDALVARVETREPEAIQRLYYGYLYHVTGFIPGRVGGGWPRVGFFMRALSACALEAIVHHRPDTDGPLLRFLALQTAAAYTDAWVAWGERTRPDYQTQEKLTTLRFSLGSIHPDEDQVRAFYERTYLSTRQIHEGLRILTESFESFPDLEPLDEPEPVWDRALDATELAGSHDPVPDQLCGDFPSPLAAVRDLTLHRVVREVLASLTPSEEKVLRMRFGIGETSDHTLEEVGMEFEVGRERIRQIEAKALRKLRHPSRSKRLRAFVEDMLEDDPSRLHETVEPAPPARPPRHPYVDTGFILTVDEARAFAYVHRSYSEDQPRFPKSLLAEMDKWGLVQRGLWGRFTISEEGMKRVRILVTREDLPPNGRLRFLGTDARYRRIPEVDWRQEILTQFEDLGVRLPEDAKRFRMSKWEYERDCRMQEAEMDPDRFT